MTADYYLRLTLPRAAPYGEELIAARRYDLEVYTNTPMGYVAVDIGPIQYAPPHIPTVAVLYQGGAEVAQFGGSQGVIQVQVRAGRDQPAALVLYNLDVDAEASYTMHMRGWMIHELPGS